MHRFNADVYESTKKQYISATVDKLWSLFNSLEMGPQRYDTIRELRERHTFRSARRSPKP